ncbi:unnamed protein product [Paramecium sonneborni]|uniref:WD40-repeat-containing domain n=1 Tax=Paramecium sonneborni TaxID=65129 RepID=A0A8S1KRB9_9CILI|nr:unnamed protein product [Paramecium sonneborni]
MFKLKMIENVQDLDCQMKHKYPIAQVVLDPQLQQNQRLLCQQCIADYETNAKTIGFKKVIQDIEYKKKKSLESIEYLIKQYINNIKSFQTQIGTLKSNIIEQLDHMIDYTKYWILNLKSTGSQYFEYSLFKELDLLINQQSTQNDYINLRNQIKNLNDCWNTKINSKLEIFKSFQVYQQCKNILNNLIELSQDLQQTNSSPVIQQNINSVTEQDNQVYNNLIPQQNYQQSFSKLKLFGNSIKQLDICNAIVFDQKSKIMVSTSKNDIKIWNFNNGIIKQIHSLQGHSKQVKCLVYSQINNYFVSGSVDGQIRIWKYYNDTQWQSSIPQNEHKEDIYDIILTQKEDQLISCSQDQSIKVWMVDINKNELKFLQSLVKHIDGVCSLSLNRSEKVLVSCGLDANIIIWKKKTNTEWIFQYVVNQSIQEVGSHVKFLRENQFIWLSQVSNTICVFETKQSDFYQESTEKRVQFRKNFEGYSNLEGFPIIYNRFRNIICLRHMCHICILEEQNDGYFSIVEELDCQDWSIQGTITNDGQYLVLWGDEKKIYETYKILYQ